MEEEKAEREKAVVSLGVPLGVPVWIFSSCKHLALFPVNFCLSALQVAHWKAATRATKTIN